MNNKWWNDSVVYQIYPRSFMDSNGDGVGDINGIRMKLDYLEDLGVDVIWLSPIYESPNDDNGYDISNYKKIMKEFGTMSDFDALIEEAHAKGLKIMLDLVVNHTSDEHIWFQESGKAKDNHYRDYYIWREGKNGGPPNNWESFFGGSAWEYDKQTSMYYLHLFSKKQPDLNWENKRVRHEIYSMMRWWLDKGIDGFRMDVINFISKPQDFPDGERIEGSQYTEKAPLISCGPRFHEFLKEMNKEVLSKYDLITVGEMPFISVSQAGKITDPIEKELDMVFQFEHMDLENEGNNKWTNKRFNLQSLKKVISKWQKGLQDKGWNSLYWNNHDQPRVVSRFGDQGEHWKESATMLATCLHLLKGTPYIYQGEEIGMTNVNYSHISDYKDIETLNAFEKYTKHYGYSKKEMMKCIHARSRDNARSPMQWNTKKYAGFSNVIPWIKVNDNYTNINVQNQLNQANSIHHYYKRLIKLRKEYPEIVLGKYEELCSESKELFCYRRDYANVTLIVACNFTSKIVAYEIPDIDDKSQEPQILISNYSRNKFSRKVNLLPYEAICFRFD